MFSNTEIIGIVACIVIAIAVAFFVMRLDDAIVSTPEAEEDAAESAAASVPAASVAAQSASAGHGGAPRPPYPGGKKLTRSQRKGHRHS